MGNGFILLLVLQNVLVTSFGFSDITVCRKAGLNCSPGSKCQNKTNSLSCLCRPGYNGVECDKDLNECNRNPCLQHGTCRNSVGSFACDCYNGWTGSHCEHLDNTAAQQSLDGCPGSLRRDPYLRRYDTFCYEFVLTDRGDWNTSNQDCIKKGGYLVDIHSRAENDFIYSSIMDLSKSLRLSLSEAIWIGLTDLEVESRWRWSHGSSLDYTNWASDNTGLTNSFRDCAYMSLTDRGQWHQSSCRAFMLNFVSYNWVCKYDVSAIPKQTSLRPVPTIDQHNAKPPTTEAFTTVMTAKPTSPPGTSSSRSLTSSRSTTSSTSPQSFLGMPDLGMPDTDFRPPKTQEQVCLCKCPYHGGTARMMNVNVPEQ